MDKKFYVTTPIYYVNDKPHIGHAYTTILADVLTRFHKMSNSERKEDRSFFLTGLDEHGQKVQQAAESRGMDPQAHCDDLSPRFINLWEKLEIQYDDFIRTTQPRHKNVVQSILQKVYDKGDIYMAEYEGWYSVSEERFITETEKDSGDFRDVKKLKERNWFFKMGQYQERLIQHIDGHPGFLQPDSRKNEILGFLKQPLSDLCISRPKTRMDWGIELPFDKDYVTYVWFDALINYISGVAYLTDDAKFNKWWPASVHLIGKDILTTHAVYWSTMLFSLELPLPETIFAHGWWLMGESKMSKSLGNVVSPLDLVDEYGVDCVRYYLMREMVLGQDARFTMESFIKRYNSDLANDFGNLLNRVSGLIGKYFNKTIPAVDKNTEAEDRIKSTAEKLNDIVPGLIEKYRLHEAIEEILQVVRGVNKYMEQQAPWKVAKEDLARAGTILYTAGEVLRVCAVHLAPVMPKKCEQMNRILTGDGLLDSDWGGLKPGFQLESHDALFPRLEMPKAQ
ncbi:MAG: methionine--tRNA ligase [Candidatus Omnitrophica bacterium]|nr:methionine--tRNA ligase [Candidatus Omnitrophota bacterium]